MEPTPAGPVEPDAWWRSWPLAAAAALLLYGLPWIWQGLDMTDVGFSLSLGWLAIDQPADYVYGPRWLSDLTLGAWTSLADGVVWARASWLLGIAAWGWLSATILAHAFEARAAAAASVVAGVACLCRDPLLLDYNLLPAVLTLGGCALLLAGPRGDEGGPARLARAAAGGWLFSLAAAARIPHLAALALPLVLLGLRAAALRRRPTRAELTGAGAALGGAVLAAGVLAGGLLAAGRWSEFAGFPARANPAYTLGLVLWIYGLTSLQALLTALEVAGTLLLLALGGKAWVARFPRQAGLARVALGALACGYAWLKTDHGDPGLATLVVSGVALGGGLVLLLGGLLARERGPADVLRLEVVGLSLACALVSPLGSSNGVTRLCFAAGPLLGAALLSLLAAQRRRDAPSTGARCAVLLALALGCAGISARWYAYRDDANRLLLRTAVDHPRLGSTFTTRGRAASVAELLAALDGRVTPGGALLAYDCLPLLHYLTRTRPALGSPWPDLYAPAQLTRRIEAWGDDPPPVVVRARTDPEDRRWGSRPLSRPRRHLPQQRLLDAAIAARPYRLAWSNGDFELLVLERAAGAPSPGSAPPGNTNTRRANGDASSLPE